MIAFLDNLKAKLPAYHTKYITAFRMLSGMGRTPFDKWHMLEKDKVPRGIAKDSKGVPYSLDAVGEFKNISHKSRIYHACYENLIVLLSAFEGKKEDELTAQMVNPALTLRVEYEERRDELIRKAQQKQGPRRSK